MPKEWKGRGTHELGASAGGSLEKKENCDRCYEGLNPQQIAGLVAGVLPLLLQVEVKFKEQKLS